MGVVGREVVGSNGDGVVVFVVDSGNRDSGD